MGRKGIALVVVLWALLLAGVLAMSFAFAMRTEAQAARNGAEATRAYYLARTGINKAVMLFASLPADNVLRETIDGGEGDGRYEVAVEREDGRIDVNLASEETIRRALGGMGLDEEAAGIVGDSILDWRDDDDLPRPHGAEEAHYLSLPEPVRPRNGKLRAVEELREVSGVSPEMYRNTLAGIFTVYGKSEAVNINAASPPVLRAVGLSVEQADRVVARRKEAPFRTPGEIATFLAAEGIPQAVLPRLGSGSASNVYTITSRGTVGTGTARIVRCRVEVGGSRGGGVRIVRWEDLVPAGEEGR